MKRPPGLWFTLLFLLACLVYAQQEPPPAEPETGAPAAAPAEQPAPVWKVPRPEPETVFDAGVWGMPLVAVHARREAFFRDAGADYGAIAYWSRPGDWRLQTATPDPVAWAVYFPFNTRRGPQVLEVPPAAGALLDGWLFDAWRTPGAGIGSAGDAAGAGGRYLLIPPEYRGRVPPGYLPVHFTTYNGYGQLRVMPEDGSAEAQRRALALLRSLRLYPLSEAVNPPTPRHIDLSGRLFDGLVHFDQRFYAALAAMVDEEPALPRDATMIADLKTLGILPGQPFKPSVANQQLFAAAAAEVRADFIRRAPALGEQFYPARRWRFTAAAGAGSDFSYETEGRLDAYARGLAAFLDVLPAKTDGETPLLLTTFADAAGQRLAGRRSYRLHLPAEVPAALWSVAVYSADSAGFFRDAPRGSLDSQSPKLQQNDDGSTDIYFGPQAPAASESNWIYTAPASHWFAMVRFQGPAEELIGKRWTLPDIEAVR